jgi:hypothetical protein
MPRQLYPRERHGTHKFPCKVTCNIYATKGHEGPEREQKYRSTLCLISALEDGVANTSAALLLGKRPGTHFIGDWVKFPNSTSK